MTKRDAPEEKEEEIEVGPMPAIATEKKRRVLDHESTFLANLPSAEQYERSLMHRDHVTFVHCTQTDFLITCSIDGHVKFWKKTQKGIEFVKHFRAHLGAIVAISVSPDGALFATAGTDKAIKLFDIVNFDMINSIKTAYACLAVCWVYQKHSAEATLICSDRESSAIHVYNGRSASAEPIHTLTTPHKSPVHILAYNPLKNIIVSVDQSGSIEYWTLTTDGYTPPAHGSLSFTYKSDTDLYEYPKHKSVPCTLTFSNDYEKFAMVGFTDRVVRVFLFATGRLVRKYDEGLAVCKEMQAGKYKVDEMEFGRRFAQEKEIEKGCAVGGGMGGQGGQVNVVFDESGNFIVYATLVGIKIVNLVTNKVNINSIV